MGHTIDSHIGLLGGTCQYVAKGIHKEFRSCDINAKFYITRLNLITSRMKNSKLTDGLVANSQYTIWLVQGCVFMVTELGKANTVISF